MYIKFGITTAPRLLFSAYKAQPEFVVSRFVRRGPVLVHAANPFRSIRLRPVHSLAVRAVYSIVLIAVLQVVYLWFWFSVYERGGGVATPQYQH